MGESAIPVAIVTGASRGIGRAIALKLAARPYRVVVNYATSSEAAESVAAAARELGTEAITLRGNIASRDDREALVEQTLQAFGRIDVLVNNAGITSPGRRDLLEATEESWDQVFDTNLKGPFFLTQQVAKVMTAAVTQGEQTGGHIINISSISAFASSTNRGDYCLTKAAMQMMTWLWADRLAEYGIGVFEIAPGIIASDMTEPVKAKYDRLIAEGLTPVRRWGQPDDIARAVDAIVGGAFPFSTGERIHVDGGFHIRRL